MGGGNEKLGVRDFFNENKGSRNGTFYCIFLYRAMLGGNQHGGCEYDDLQNRLDMTSRERRHVHL